MFKFKRLDEIKLQLNEIERTILELVQLTRTQAQHIDYMYQDVLRKKINDAANKNEQEKRSPYINKIRKAAKGRKKQMDKRRRHSRYRRHSRIHPGPHRHQRGDLHRLQAEGIFRCDRCHRRHDPRYSGIQRPVFAFQTVLGA